MSGMRGWRIEIRLNDAEKARLDEWRVKQPAPPSQAEALRCAIKEFLDRRESAQP